MDRDVQEVVGRLLGSAVRRRWPVPPGWSCLPGQRLETCPDHHGCLACSGRSLRLVGSEVCHRSDRRRLRERAELGVPQVSAGVGQMAAGSREDRGGQAADQQGGENQQVQRSRVPAGEGGHTHNQIISNMLMAT